MEARAMLGSRELTVWFIDFRFVTRSASFSTRNHVLVAAILLLLAALPTATDEYEINRQTLESALAKRIIPFLPASNRDRLDRSVSSVPDYYSSYTKLKVPSTVPPIPILEYPAYKYLKICTVTTPKPHDKNLLPSVLRQLYDKTLFYPSSTNGNVPKAVSTNQCSTYKYTNENLKFMDYQLIPAMLTTSIKTIDDNLRTMLKVIDEQRTSVTDTLQIPAVVDINVPEEKNTQAYNDVMTVPDKDEYNLTTETTTELDSTSGTMAEISDNVTNTSGDNLDAVFEDTTTLPSSQIQDESRSGWRGKCEDKYSSRLSPLNTNQVTNEKGTLGSQNKTLFDVFKQSLLRLERNFLSSTFTKLTDISPEERKVNGISFIQSGLFLHMLLIALTTEADQSAVEDIEDCLELCGSNEDRIAMLNHVTSWLPESSDTLKFRWSSRLVVNETLRTSARFRVAADAMNLTLSHLSTDEADAMTKTLNDMVEKDSGGTMHDTFEEEELSRGACGVALATVYVRARWRAAPTLLNGTATFRDGATNRTARFYRVNDVVRYAYLPDWDAEAIDIPYATPGLSLLVVVPREPSLRTVVERVASEGLAPLVAASRDLRAAVTLPLYTLRMTLLLPNKLIHMGMPSLVDVNNTDCRTLKLTHAVQRLMFWSEAGRNAFKDDGIEWDPHPDLEVKVDRPYLFFVRWQNFTLLNGNFVL